MSDSMVCYRHSDNRAGVSCQRCSRPICANCMRQASVGFHCPECVKSSGTKVITARQLLHGRPLITQILIGANVAVFVAMVIAAGGDITGESDLFFEGTLFAGISDSVLGVLMPGIAQGEWWRIVTSGFLHFGLFHLAMNMYVLWLLGQLLEPVYGRPLFAALYVTSMMGGSLGALLMDPFFYTAGASGAVFGLMGAGLVVYWSRGVNPMQTSLGQVVMINLVITFIIPGISVGGHLGGLISGAAAAYLVTALDKQNQHAMGLPAVAALGVSCAIAALLVAYQSFASGQAFIG